MSDHERGAYTPPHADAPLSFDPRQPVRGARPIPLTLILSVLVLAALVAAILWFYQSGVRQAGELLDEPGRPTAIFCFSDEMAMGALEAIRQRGLECPRDVSLVGFDDIRFAQYLHPQLTTVSQPKEQIGHEVVRLLLDILGDRASTLQNVTLPHQLIVRASTAPPSA